MKPHLKNHPRFQPAEWAEHRATWLAWPSHAELWGEDLLPKVQDEFTAFCHQIAETSPGATSEKLEVLVYQDDQRRIAERRLQGLPVRFHSIAFGDIWLRDTAPIFLKNAAGETIAHSFRFNGWGGKYNLPGDNRVSERIAEASHCKAEIFPFILEGGSVEVNGSGLCLTTEQCLLNPNRNKNPDRSEMEEHLKTALGVEEVLWLKRGLLNDHTDGHIDTLARFVSEDMVVCMKAKDSSDPNALVLAEIETDLRTLHCRDGEHLKVVELPSPGKILDDDGKIMPASYVNFYISNSSVIVPTYGVDSDREAVDILKTIFSHKKVVGLSARLILKGGGAFHCITQQEPL